MDSFAPGVPLRRSPASDGTPVLAVPSLELANVDPGFPGDLRRPALRETRLERRRQRQAVAKRDRARELVSRLGVDQAGAGGAVVAFPTRQLERDVHSLVENLAVPEAPPRLPELPRTHSPAAEKPQPRPSLTQDVRRRLEEIDRLLVAKADPREVPPERANTQKDLQEPLNPKEASSSTSSTQQPRMLIQASQARSGSSKYLARVQHNISKHWIAPPVDLASRSLVVVIQFRLHRSGMVSHVLVEQPSGNDYYDLSAERAVLSANPLPSFPHSLRAPYLDTHFTFAVGEQVG